jgi:hypothetical protein
MTGLEDSERAASRSGSEAAWLVSLSGWVVEGAGVAPRLPEPEGWGVAEREGVKWFSGWACVSMRRTVGGCFSRRR